MQELPVHPLFVHFPLVLSLVIPFLSLFVLIAWKKEWFSKKLWFLVVAFQVIFVATSMISMKTGENDEHRIKSKEMHAHIHDHEEAAEKMTYSAIALLLLGLAAALCKNEKRATIFASVFTVGSFVVFALALYTGEEGGELVYKYKAVDFLIEAEKAE